ncbi:GGDEF domain-containing protein [Allokutzneria oryzae]|uniref:GGDEF domain-containing protein n=1 Tax=Allokutzneria oryzae TaxID=1378989 RepID=A0ABV5ZYI7_9PSEU
MGTREFTPRVDRERDEGAIRTLRARWRATSLAAGWPFPSDWALAEVDEVCRAHVLGGDTAPALNRLAQSRAQTGAGLAETLQDLAALHAVLTSAGPGAVPVDPDAVPVELIRAHALAWADVLSRQVGEREAEDGLTGLATTAYLRTRLREVYREARSREQRCEDEYGLVLVATDLSAATGWSRLVVMVLIAEVVRLVFDSGETLAAVGPSVAAVLARRDDRLQRRVAATAWLVKRRLAVDPDLDDTGPVRVWLERLPTTPEAAGDLITHLARA